MNNTCPACGAAYNVSARDIGRRISCKKCGTPLAVTDPILEPVTEQNVHDVVSGTHGSTTFSTVSSFKGLENDYIVLADVETLDGDWWRSVIYVGMSRARAGLCVLVPNSLRPTYDACVNRALLAALS
jgi:predicted Zn finger-like uncharacterized protein